MKKLITLFSVIFLAFSMQAQVLIQNGHTNVPQKIQHSKINKTTLNKGTKASNERWYNFGETMDIFYGNTSDLNGNNLFPDTTILVNYGTSGYSGPWIHALTDVLDVKSSMFNDITLHPGELAMNAASTYTLDSIGILCYYERNMVNPAIVDTLLIEVTANATLPSYFFTASGINTNLGADTVFLHGISYDYMANTVGLPGKKTYKFPLTEQFYIDSLSNGLHYVEISTSDLTTVMPGKYVTTTVTFIPGYTWVANVDTLTSKNRFFFLSYKEQDGMFPIYLKKDYNISYIASQDLRYNVAGSWNGLFIPSFAYMGTAPTYSYEHHLFYYKTTCTTNCSEVGIEAPVTQISTTLGDAYPNPSQNNANIHIPVSVNTANAQLTVKNILGQMVMSYNNISQGNTELTINTQNLPAGVYLYTLEAGNEIITKKFSITK